MNRKYYIFLFLCIVAVATLTYYGINTNKEREVSYYVIKETSSCMAECEEGVKEIYTKYYSTEESEGVRATFSEIVGTENERGYLIMYQSSNEVIRYTFDDEGELINKTVSTVDGYNGYFWWGSYTLWSSDPIEVGQKWERNVTIKSYDMENQQSAIMDMDLHCETEVLSYEKVKVEAGNFNCYKVKLVQSGEYERENIKKIVKYTITLWYSPDLKIVIKDSYISQFGDFECTSTSELIEYR